VTNRKSPERKGKVQLVDAREYWVKMRKSLGEKRKLIPEEQIAEITRLYGGFAEGEKVKILPSEALGFMRIMVERPLRLRWEVAEDSAERLAEDKAWGKLSETEQQKLSSRLAELAGSSTTERKVLADKLGAVPKAISKAAWNVLAVPDPDAPVVTDANGHPEPDPDLRDNENVPLPAVQVEWAEDPSERLAFVEYRTAVDDYLRDEIFPYVPDAWVDHAKTKIGYEIPLTRVFYRYVPLRPLEEIDAEIKALEKEIQDLLGEVAE
jgi:type I restriction enzyme M protein